MDNGRIAFDKNLLGMQGFAVRDIKNATSGTAFDTSDYCAFRVTADVTYKLTTTGVGAPLKAGTVTVCTEVDSVIFNADTVVEVM